MIRRALRLLGLAWIVCAGLLAGAGLLLSGMPAAGAAGSLVPPATSAPHGPRVGYRDGLGAPIAPGSHVCGIQPLGEGFAPGDAVDWSIEFRDGQALSGFRDLVNADGVWRGALYYPPVPGPLQLEWTVALGSPAGGAMAFENDCIATPEPWATPAPTARPTLPPTDTLS